MTLTPEQFNKIATKDDLNDLRQDMATKKEHNEVMNTLDAVMKKLDTIEHAFVFNQAAHDRFEQRLTKIEQHLGLNPYNIAVNNT